MIANPTPTQGCPPLLTTPIYALRYNLADTSRALTFRRHANHQTMPFNCEGRNATGSINANVHRDVFAEAAASRPLFGGTCMS
jgi:hypothetical protein